MYTELGLFLREVRKSRGELLKHMADKLGMSSSELSQLEHGRKEIPQLFDVKLSIAYNLTNFERIRISRIIYYPKGEN